MGDGDLHKAAQKPENQKKLDSLFRAQTSVTTRIEPEAPAASPDQDVPAHMRSHTMRSVQRALLRRSTTQFGDNADSAANGYDDGIIEEQFEDYEDLRRPER